MHTTGYGAFPSNLGIVARYLLTDNIPPTVTLTSPANATYAASVNIKLSAAASDSDGTITKVEFYNGTTLLHTETVVPYGYLWKNVPAGTYTLTAKATDNTGAQTTSAPIKVIVNAAPTVSLTSPANAVYTAPVNLKLSAAASDLDGTITKVEFYNGSALLHTETAAPYGYLWKNVRAGTYTLTAKATDNSGAQTMSAPVKVIVNKAPIVTLTAPANNAAYTAPAIIKLSAAASDSDGTISKVEFYNSTTLLHTETVIPYGYLWKNVAAGTYTITAVAIDNFGAKTTSAPITITVTSLNTMMVSNRPFAKSEKTALNDALSLSLYPNPATNIVQVYTKGLQQDKPTTISVISASGVIMKTVQLNSLIQTQLNISSLAKGVYTIKIVSGDKVMHKQFVKL